MPWIVVMLHWLKHYLVLLLSYAKHVLISHLLLQKLSMSAGCLAVNVLVNSCADAEYRGLVNELTVTAANNSKYVNVDVGTRGT